jgi:hypothetical protein
MKRYLVIFIMLASTNGYTAISKWVDSDGNVHYSDQAPPADTKAKKLRSSPDNEGAADSNSKTATSAPAAPKTLAEKEAELKKAQKAKQETADKAAKEQANAEATKAYCTAAQQNLKALQDGIRLVEIDTKGEHSYLDDAQRQQRIAKAQKDISTYCK